MNITSIKERIALGEALTTHERDFVLDCINEATSPPGTAATMAIIDGLIAQRDGWVKLCRDLNEIVAGFLDALPPELAELPGPIRARKTAATVRDLITAFRP